jgi:hypothetical protein
MVASLASSKKIRKGNQNNTLMGFSIVLYVLFCTASVLLIFDGSHLLFLFPVCEFWTLEMTFLVGPGTTGSEGNLFKATWVHGSLVCAINSN